MFDVNIVFKVLLLGDEVTLLVTTTDHDDLVVGFFVID